MEGRKRGRTLQGKLFLCDCSGHRRCTHIFIHIFKNSSQKQMLTSTVGGYDGFSYLNLQSHSCHPKCLKCQKFGMLENSHIHI